jgi:murein L,D-transpeptidase YcbB/YkuD
MEKLSKLFSGLNLTWKTGGKIVIVFLLFSIFGQVITAKPGAALNVFFMKGRDTTLSAEIKRQLDDKINASLYYPKSVQRFYKLTGYKEAWIKPQKETGQAWQAMLMMDCVLQFGLAHADYHPQELLYTTLHDMMEKTTRTGSEQKARFDIFLTDALITFMNHLHFGKLNPEYPAARIDEGNTGSYCPEALLANALAGKDIMTAVVSVQPKSPEYKRLQYRMHLLTGLYTGDCYEIPEEEVRKIAINMERLRWANIEDGDYIHINIPSYTLTLHQPDTVYQFKVIVGKPANPTPTLQSTVHYFTTAPEWRVPKKIFVTELLPKALKNGTYMENSHFSIYNNKGRYIIPTKAALATVSRNPGSYYARQSSGCDNSLGLIVFRFPNVYDIYLHDTPEQQLFDREERDLSHGCIRVQQAQLLARLLLKNDGAENKIADMNAAIAVYKNKTFTLKKPVPIKITYLTCEVKEGVLIQYKDLYNLDKSLEMALYNIQQPLTMK